MAAHDMDAPKTESQESGALDQEEVADTDAPAGQPFIVDAERLHAILTCGICERSSQDSG